MNPFTLGAAAIAFIIGASLTLVVLRMFDFGQDSLAFIVGAVLGTQIGAIIHAKQPDTECNMKVKAILGLVLAAVDFVFGMIVHFGFGGLEFPELTLGLGAIGTFLFPFFLFGQMFTSIRRSQETLDTDAS